jgi:hypothetical protein
MVPRYHCGALLHLHDELVLELVLVPELFALVLDEQDIDEDDFVPVGALVAQVALGEPVFPHVECAIPADHEAPATCQGLAVALDAEVVPVGMVGSDLDAILRTGVQGRLHRILRHAVQCLTRGRQADISVHVLQKHLRTGRNVYGEDLEVQRLAVRDLPRQRVVVGGVDRLDDSRVSCQLVFRGQVATFQVVTQHPDGVRIHGLLVMASVTASRNGKRQERHQGKRQERRRRDSQTSDMHVLTSRLGEQLHNYTTKAL